MNNEQYRLSLLSDRSRVQFSNRIIDKHLLAKKIDVTEHRVFVEKEKRVNEILKLTSLIFYFVLFLHV